jgi:hypothetical protein
VDAALGLLLLAVYIVGVVSFAAGVTYAVIRIFPTERKPKENGEPSGSARPAAAPGNGGATGAGSLFRRSKRRLSG